MPRRAGKAASRRARQRSSQRQRQPAPVPRPQDDAVVVPPVGTPDARAAESLAPPRRVTPPVPSADRSRLSSNEVEEYHYVSRDLRNIGILTGALVVVLLVAWAVFQALGLTT